MNALRRNITSAAGQAVLQSVLLLLLYRYLIHTIGIERFGTWSVVLATAAASQISDLGLSGSVTKFVAKYRSQSDDKTASEVVQTAILTLGLVMGLVVALLYPALGWGLQFVLPSSALQEGRMILPFALISLWTASSVGTIAYSLDACLRSDLRAGLMISGSVVLFGLSVVLVRQYGLLGLAIAQVSQGALLVVLGWTLLRRAMATLPLVPVVWNKRLFKEMIGYGTSFQINSLVMLMFEPSAKVLLTKYGGLASVGFFEMAQRMVVKARGVIVESNRVIVPVFAGLHETNPSHIRVLYLRNLALLFFAMTPAFAALVGLTAAISEVWVGMYEPQFIWTAVFLTVAWYVNALAAPAYFAYLGSGRLRWVTLTHVAMGAVNIAAGLTFGRYFGAIGVIASFGAALMLGSMLLMYVYHRENAIPLFRWMSRDDLTLFAWSVVGSIVVLVGYSQLLRSGLTLSVRLSAALVASAALFCTASLLHPTGKIFLAAMRSRLRRPALAD